MRQARYSAFTRRHNGQYLQTDHESRGGWEDEILSWEVIWSVLILPETGEVAGRYADGFFVYDDDTIAKVEDQAS